MDATDASNSRAVRYRGFPRLTHVESGESVKVRDDDGMEFVGWAIPESVGGGGGVR